MVASQLGTAFEVRDPGAAGYPAGRQFVVLRADPRRAQPLGSHRNVEYCRADFFNSDDAAVGGAVQAGIANVLVRSLAAFPYLSEGFPCSDAGTPSLETSLRLKVDWWEEVRGPEIVGVVPALDRPAPAWLKGFGGQVVSLDAPVSWTPTAGMNMNGVASLEVSTALVHRALGGATDNGAHLYVSPFWDGELHRATISTVFSASSASAVG